MPETQGSASESAVPPSHTIPHEPQLFGSVVLSTHFEAQQLMTIAAPEQTLEQAPQLLGFVVRSTQAIPHGVRPAPHSGACPESSSPVSALPVLVSAVGVPVSSYVTVPS